MRYCAERRAFPVAPFCIIRGSDFLTNKERFDEKLSTEYAAFKERMRERSPDQIMSAAYEIVSKEEMVIVFENNEFSEDEYAALLRVKSPLNSLYMSWLATDSADMEDIRTLIETEIAKSLEVQSHIKLVTNDEPIADDTADTAVEETRNQAESDEHMRAETDTADKPPATEQKTDKQAKVSPPKSQKKPSLTGRLHDANDEAKEYNAKFSDNAQKQNHKKKQERD